MMNKKELASRILFIEAVLCVSLFFASLISSTSWIFALTFSSILLLILHFIRIIELAPKKLFSLYYGMYVSTLLYLSIILVSLLANTTILPLQVFFLCVSEVFIVLSLILTYNRKVFSQQETFVKEKAKITPYYDEDKKAKKPEEEKAMQRLREKFRDYELEKKWRKIHIQDEIINKELENVREELEKLKKEKEKIITEELKKKEIEPEKTEQLGATGKKIKLKVKQKQLKKKLKKKEKKIRTHKKYSEKSGEFFVVSENGKNFHRLSCTLAKRISAKKQLIFTVPKEALQAGYKPCNVCFPLPDEDKDRTLISSKDGDTFHRPSCIVAKKIPKNKRIYYRGEKKAINSKKKPCELCRPLAE